MAHQSAKPQQVSQFPLPPRRYYQSISTQPLHPPPPPPANHSYSMFGRVYTTDDVLPTLEHAGRKRLYDPAGSPCSELRTLNNSLLELFLNLVDQLCDPLTHESPSDPHKQIIDRIEDTFINMQHLINTMRPAQAAMDLKALLDNQTASRKQITDNLKDSVKTAWDLIADAADKLSQPSYQLSETATTYMQRLQNPNQQPPMETHHQPNKVHNGTASTLFDDLMPASPAPPKPPATELLQNITHIMNHPTL
ncbi:Mediator of RNA polymerase II transcription subunit 7 [Gracilariopsis chorda]|uniref:Mediator of RNA polymerase II transcription subunit 7 n=1 Tax=Gracilariopsis chorda TaxID=448386 RepID=A0A2V3IKS1_9FLOR|nr:Mediator of RNA polymerase II transcription subunit 7 [Gracilariopsis chorda]|eukprot:PXF41730.1 Mediator of RNA polymerase II transcription subunit 7 [Gracilariopsis chorda]